MGSRHPKSKSTNAVVNNGLQSALSQLADPLAEAEQVDERTAGNSPIVNNVLPSGSGISTTGNLRMENQRAAEADELRQQLEGKNELIAALVAELEQVVEQLDRVKRSGNDRSRSGSSAAALPADVVEEHQQVLGEMQRVVQEWGAMQASSALGRIESELAELRSLVANGISRHPEHDDESRSQSGSLESVMSRLSMDGPSTGSENSGAAWDAMKRQMLGEPEPEPETGHDDRDVENELTTLLDSLTVPDPIDFDTATVTTLRQACADRDTYIVQITRWVRTRRTVSIPENWEEIDVPDDLRPKVERLAARLEEQVRLAEVEMSLERARLSREKSQLQADRATMDRHMKRLGITSLDELEDIAVSSSSSGDRRWMRFLGVNRKS